MVCDILSEKIIKGIIVMHSPTGATIKTILGKC